MASARAFSFRSWETREAASGGAERGADDAVQPAAARMATAPPKTLATVPTPKLGRSDNWASPGVRAQPMMSHRDSMSIAAGFQPKPPIILTNVSCCESREEAQEKAFKYLGRKWQSIDDHYHFSDGHLANVKGYEAYGKTAKTYAKLKDPANLKKATDFYISIQIVGTPDDCLEQIGALRKVTGLDHLVTEFAFGNLPHHEAEAGLRLFADKVLPTLQHDPAFAAAPAAAGAAPRLKAGHGDIFAPA